MRMHMFKRLVSVVKMATVLEDCTIEEQRSVVRLFVSKRTQCRRIFTNKCFLFMVGSVCRAKWFTTASGNVAIVSLITKMLKRRCRSG
jgi:hypothetical protein